MKKSTYTKVLLMGGLAMVSATAQAAFSYNPNDLFLVFRNGTTKDVVVDIGSISLYNQKNGGLFTVGGYTTAQLNTAFNNNLNNVYWGIYGWNPSSSNDGITDRTLWATRSRANINVPATPFDTKNAQGQQNTLAQMKGVNDNFVNYATYNPGDANATSVVIPIADVNSMTTYVGNGQLDFSARMTDTIENTTGLGVISRSDLIQMEPSASPVAGTELGAFTLNIDGTMQFEAVPEPGTYALLGLGTLGMYFFRRYCKQS